MTTNLKDFKTALIAMFDREFKVDRGVYILWPDDVDSIVDLAANLIEVDSSPIKEEEEPTPNDNIVPTAEEVQNTAIEVGFGKDETSPINFVKKCVEDFRVDIPPGYVVKTMRLSCNKKFRNLIEWESRNTNNPILGPLHLNQVGTLETDESIEDGKIRLNVAQVGQKYYSYKLGTVFGMQEVY